MQEAFKGSKADQVLKVMKESEFLINKHLDGVDILIDMVKGSMNPKDPNIKGMLKELEANGLRTKKVFGEYKKNVETALGYKVK